MQPASGFSMLSNREARVPADVRERGMTQTGGPEEEARKGSKVDVRPKNRYISHFLSFFYRSQHYMGGQGCLLRPVEHYA